MAEKFTAEEIGRWDRWFAVEMNNLAWGLAEKPARTKGEEEAMVHAAHAAAAHWGRIGGELERARADMLLGHAHALAGNGSLAMKYARRCHHYFAVREFPDWEIAFVHAVLANAARAAGEEALYAEQAALAERAGEAIADKGDREAFERTFG